METIFFEKPIVISNEETLMLEHTYLESGTGTVAYHAYWKEPIDISISGSYFDPYRQPVLDHHMVFVERCKYCGRKNPSDADECKGCGAIL